MNALVLVGGGGHCRSCIDLIEAGAIYAVSGVVDRVEQGGGNILGYPFLGDDTALPELIAIHKHALVTIGQIRSPDARIRLYNMLVELGAVLPTILSPLAYASRHAHIGAGSAIFHGAIVNAAAIVGENCIINSRALVEHDTNVADHCHISTAATVNGGCSVGRGTFIGSGAVIHQGVRIGAGCVIAAAAVVKADVPDGTLFRAH